MREERFLLSHRKSHRKDWSDWLTRTRMYNNIDYFRSRNDPKICATPRARGIVAWAVSHLLQMANTCFKELKGSLTLYRCILVSIHQNNTIIFTLSPLPFCRRIAQSSSYRASNLPVEQMNICECSMLLFISGSTLAEGIKSVRTRLALNTWLVWCGLLLFH